MSKYGVVFLGGKVQYSVAVTNLETNESELLPLSAEIAGHENDGFDHAKAQLNEILEKIKVGDVPEGFIKV